MKTLNKLPSWVWGAVVLVAVMSLYSMSLRHRVEARNKAVAPALELEVIASAAASSGVGLTAALEELEVQGLRAVVLPESNLGDWVRLKRVDLSYALGGPVFTGTPEDLDIVRAACARRGIETIGTRNSLLLNGAPGALWETVSLGLDPIQAAEIDRAGLFLIARHSNHPSPTLAYIQEIIADSAEKGADAYLPQGDAVLGNRSQIKAAMQVLREHGLLYCSPEFAKITGETTMTVAGPGNTVRLHSIQAAEIERMAPSEVVERFARAYAERNQRVLLIRPFDAGGSTPLESLKLSLAKISKSVTKEGGGLAAPRSWEDPGIPTWVNPALTIGVLLACVATILAVFNQPTFRGAAIALVSLICAFSLARQDATFVATLGATAFPILAFVSMREREDWPPLAQFALVSLVSLVGGLCVAGLLNSVPFYVRADSFFAVKLAHFFPILVAGVLVARQMFDLPKLAITPITWGALGLLGVSMVGLMFMLARTGNDNPAAVSGLELQFRSLLEKYFNTRPRTKEFLIGHPAMIIGLFMQAHARRQKLTQPAAFGALLTVLGMIGQTSVVNTMCHLHTPVQVGLVRIFIGLVTGLLVGLVAWIVVRRAVFSKAK